MTCRVLFTFSMGNPVLGAPLLADFARSGDFQNLTHDLRR
jgi:hypothetical protein